MKLKLLIFVFSLLLSLEAGAQCTMANYMAAVRIPIASYPYTALSAPTLTVSVVNSGVPTLANSSYSCGPNLYGGASPAWWLNGAAQSLTFNFSSPVTSLTFLINGTNSTEVFYIVSNSTCAISLSNFCTVGFTSVGGTLTAGPTAGLGSIITVNNPGGATQYKMTHNGLGAGSRVTLLDCFVKGSGTCVLPIELTEFKGQCRSNNEVELNWTTASEAGNDFFTIEVSADAEQWADAATIKGAGNSTVIKNYSYRHKNSTNGISYYRLKQTDFNHSFKYSEIITVNNCRENGTGEITIYPNPASGEIIIKTDADGLTTEIYTLLGEKVQEITLERGENKIDISQFKASTYTVRITRSGREAIFKKLIIQ